MTDLVDELYSIAKQASRHDFSRGSRSAGDVVDEAADEIERLRKAIRNMMAHAGAARADVGCRAVIAAGKEALGETAKEKGND